MQHPGAGSTGPRDLGRQTATAAGGLSAAWAGVHHWEALRFGDGWGALVGMAVLAVAGALVGRLWLSQRILAVEGGRREARLLASVAVAVVVWLIVPVELRVTPLGPIDLDGGLLALYRVTVAVASIATIALAVLLGWGWSVDRAAPPVADRPPASRWRWARLAAPSWAVWSLYLLAFWPAVMSVDSVKQWEQLITGELSDAHPAFHTMTMWLLTRLWWSPAAVAVVQVAVLGGIVGVVLAGLLRSGVPRRVVNSVAVLVALLPATGLFAVTLWKDVAYAGAVLVLTHVVLGVVRSDGAWLDRRRAPLALGGAAAAVTLFHHGGRLVALGTLALLLVTYRSRWRPVTAGWALAAVAWVVVQGVLLPSVDVVRDHPGTGQIAIHHIAAHLDAGTAVTRDERAVLAEVLPTRWTYNCQSHNSVVHSREPGRADRWKALGDRAGELSRISVALFVRDPMVDVRHMLCNTRLVWRVRGHTDGSEYSNAVDQELEGPLTEESLLTVASRGKDLDLRRAPVIDSLTLPLARLVLETSDPQLSWLFWRAPLALLALLGATAVAVARTSNGRFALVAAPALLVSAVVVAAAPAQDFRYQFPVYLVAVVLAAPLATFGAGGRRRISSDEPTGTGARR